MWGSIAGFSVEIPSEKKLLERYHIEPVYWRHRGKDVCSYISYCASHKVPNPNMGVRIPEEKSIFNPNRNEVQILIEMTNMCDLFRRKKHLCLCKVNILLNL